eukprot:2182096-Amphidinium_carterae.2
MLTFAALYHGEPTKHTRINVEIFCERNALITTPRAVDVADLAEKCDHIKVHPCWLPARGWP